MKVLSQNTNTVLMIKPTYFNFNYQTAGSNVFQVPHDGLSDDVVQSMVIKEFDIFVNDLKKVGINVIVFDDKKPVTPDAVFPNNWVSFHQDDTIVLYPMLAPNRRLERRDDVVDKLKSSFNVSRIIDLSSYEKENTFLEGTGSLVLDRINKIAYACLSPRTNESMLEIFSKEMGYEIVKFKAIGRKGNPVYHTNVVMSVGDKFAVVCVDAIQDKEELRNVMSSLQDTGHEVISISVDQMHHFAGNVIQLTNSVGKKFLIISKGAVDSLNSDQKIELEKYSEMLVGSVDTIEKYGGGSVQCMFAEIFLSIKV